MKLPALSLRIRVPRRGQFLALLAVLMGCGTVLEVYAVDTLEMSQQVVELAGKRFEVILPKHLQLEVLATGLGGPRMLSFAPNGDLFAGSRSGSVYRIPPPYTDPEEIITLAHYPHSVAFRDKQILIAQTTGLYAATYNPGQSRLEPSELKQIAKLPGGGGHTSRSVKVGPDSRIYVSLGISGNCSDQYLHATYGFNDRRGGILVLDESTEEAKWKTFASGLRNPVGFDWHPLSDDLYASNNGPDHLGFDSPPEYFSRISAGSFHGMPWFQFDGETIRRDPCIRSAPPRQDVTPPVAVFPARNAPMDVAFVPRGALLTSLEGDAIVALRGSWGTPPSGSSSGDRAGRRPPALVAVRFSGAQAIQVDNLLTGFQLSDGTRWARPVGLAIGPQGGLYFSSDHGVNALFRLIKITNKP